MPPSLLLTSSTSLADKLCSRSWSNADKKERLAALRASLTRWQFQGLYAGTSSVGRQIGNAEHAAHGYHFGSNILSSKIDNTPSKLQVVLSFHLLTSPAFDSLRTCCADVRDTTAPYRLCLLYFHTRRCRRGQLARWSGKRTLTSVDGAFRLSDSGSETAWEGTIRDSSGGNGELSRRESSSHRIACNPALCSTTSRV